MASLSTCHLGLWLGWQILLNLVKLKCAGINQTDWARIYVSVIRPVVEYAFPVWHTNLPKYLSDNIEIIQKRCLKSIFPGFTYEDILQMVNIPTLHDRRNAICKAYFDRMRRGDHKLNKLQPDTRMVSYALRSFNELPVPMANTNREKLVNTMLFGTPSKHLNGLSGMFYHTIVISKVIYLFSF